MNRIKFGFIFFCIMSVFYISANEVACNSFNINNYRDIMDNKKNGLYENPFHSDRCFILSFDKTDPIDNFLSDDDDLNKYILLYHDNDGVFVAHIKNQSSTHYFNTFNFRMDSRAGKLLKTMVGFYKNIEVYFPEIFFIHEIYHLKEVDFDGDYRYDEIEADLFAAFILINRYNLNMEAAQNLIYNLYQLRVSGLDDKFDGDEEMLNHYTIRANQVILMINEIQKDDDFLDIHHLFEESKRIEFN